jgi:AcrR family transcriptional regulator
MASGAQSNRKTALAAAPDARGDSMLERSRLIVDAAYALLDEEGLEGLTIRAVLKRTGLSRRAFYERFAGKDDLMLAVFEQTLEQAARYYGTQVAGLPDPLDQLKLIVTSIVLGRSPLQKETGANRRNAALSREHLRLAESRPKDLQAALSPLLSLFAQLLADGMKMGVVRVSSPQQLATLVYNLVSTTVHSELLAHEGVQPAKARNIRLADDIWEFCRRAIAV